jgi:uncharacterized LabA/DUF88 family protein
MQKVVVVMDFANIDRSSRDQGLRMDYDHLLNEYLANQSEGRFLQAASAYVPLDPRNEHGRDANIDRLWKAGFIVKTKVGTIAGDSYKCNLDIEMVMDVMKSVYEMKPDILVLASGDVDFVPMVLELRSSGIYVEVAGFTNSTSSLLRERASSFINLDTYCDEFFGQDNPEGENNPEDETNSGNENSAETIDAECNYQAAGNNEVSRGSETMFNLPGQL